MKARGGRFWTQNADRYWELFGDTGNWRSVLEAHVKNQDLGDVGQWRAEQEKRVKLLLNEKGFWEGGVIPNGIEEALLIVWT